MENFDLTNDRPIDDVYMSEDDGGGNREDEAQEVHNNPAGEAIKPKRIIKNPQPKLDANRLMGPRGVGILPSTFKGTKFKGKGCEKNDLNLLMKKLEHWAHRLFPKLTFDDTLKQIEKLGTKKPVQNLVRRIRLDIYQNDEIVDGTENASTEDNAVGEVDVFDEILGTGIYATNTNIPLTGNSNVQHLTDLFLPATPIVSSSPASQKQMTLTDEQKERIERNKRLAAERRKAKTLLQKNYTEIMEEGCDYSSQNFSSLHKIPNSNLEVINANETIRTVGEAVSSSISPVPSIEMFDPTCRSKLHETVAPNESTDLSKIVCNDKQNNDRHNSNSNDSFNADLVTTKSSEICTEDDILALMDNDV